MNATGMRQRAPALAWLSVCAFVVLLITGPFSASDAVETWFDLALLLDGTLLVAFLTRRPVFALMVSDVVFGSLLIAGALKFHYLITPLLAPDLVYFLNRDLLEVATRYPSIMVALVAAAILIPGLLIAAWRLDRPTLFASLRSAQRRALQTTGVLATLVLLLVVDAPTGPFSSVFDEGMWARMNDRSYLVDFFTSFYQTRIHVPPRVAQAVPPVTWTEPPRDNPPACHPRRCSSGHGLQRAQAHPDIVAILEESTFDPRMLKVCTLPLCHKHMFEADGRTRAHGPLTVHVWGGGTWTSEFALMTGLNHNSFGEAGLYAPYNLAPRVVSTLPRVLHKAGYRCIAIYPMTGDFINARNAYRDYGFDHFYDGEDFGLSWESTDSDLMQVFDRIYAQEKLTIGNQPLFVMMLTLRQHGPHMTPLKQLPPPYDKPLFPGAFKPPELDAWLNRNLGNYLYRLAGSDAAISHIEKTLLDGERPALLFHFGDHQPSFDGAIRELRKTVPASVPDANFITYYMLKTNFRPAHEYHYPALDLSLAGSLILDVAGVAKDRFFQANALLRERCDGAYLDCTDKSLLNTYRNYVFYRLHDLHD